MHDMQAIKTEYVRLDNADAKEAIIDLLTPVVRSGTTVSADDRGWAYWNICDNYAMLRKAKEQYAYQSEFFDWSRTTLPPLRQHWVVSDATQAMTLIQGGFLDFWWDCYQFANASAPHVTENRAARFESHRANAAACTYFREFNRAETVLQALEAVLSEDPLWVNRDFSKVTFTTLLLEFHSAQGQHDHAHQYVMSLERDLTAWVLQGQRSATFSGISLLGSWEQLNAPRPPGAIVIAIHNFACALAKARYFMEAEKWFGVVLREDEGGMTTYSQALYMLACWHNRRNQDEVRGLLASFQPVALEQILKFAPELTEVFGKYIPPIA